MNTDTYATLDERILAFFQRNPFEEMSCDDMAVKFDTTPGYVAQALTRLRVAGWRIDRTYVYRLSRQQTSSR